MRIASTLRSLWRAASWQTRAGVHALVLLTLGVRLLVFGTALAVDRHEARVALLVGLATSGCVAGQRLVQALLRPRLDRDLHRATVAALLRGDVLEVGRERTQRVVFESGYQAGQLLGTVAPPLGGDLLAVLVIVPIVVAELSTRLLASAALALGVLGVGVLVARRFVARAQERLAEASEEVGESLLVAIEGRLELVARGEEREFERRFAALSDRYVARAARVGLVSAWLGRAPLAIGAAAIGAVALFDSSSRAELTAALLTRALVLAACLPPLLGTVMGIQAVGRTSALARPFATLLSIGSRSEREVGAAPALPADIVVEDVSFRYAEDQPLVMAGVSFAWSAGQPLVLVGPNGSGKSTLLKLLLGLRPPTSGAIRVGGVELGELDRQALRRRAAYLPQRPYLGEAHGTVRAALAMAVPDATDEAMKRELERVKLLAALEAHAPEPLATTVGTLSAGQRQRLALARVLLQPAALVLFDEPDANLDRDGIVLVASLVKELIAEGKMVAIAAHTPELGALAERAVTLGRV